MKIKKTKAFEVISKYYGDKKAKRSKVPLINHCIEGAMLLQANGVPQYIIDAYHLHPIFQLTEDFNSNLDIDLSGINPKSIILAIEYRHVANSFLSKDKKEKFIGFTNEDIRWMLRADKWQNYKDFMNYHYGKHPNSNVLFTYFCEWFELLDFYPAEFVLE